MTPNTILTGFYRGTFTESPFSLKIQSLYCLVSSVALWDDPIVDTEGTVFEI